MRYFAENIKPGSRYALTKSFGRNKDGSSKIKHYQVLDLKTNKYSKPFKNKRDAKAHLAALNRAG